MRIVPVHCTFFSFRLYKKHLTFHVLQVTFSDTPWQSTFPNSRHLILNCTLLVLQKLFSTDQSVTMRCLDRHMLLVAFKYEILNTMTSELTPHLR